jgi:hypothetical protein
MTQSGVRGGCLVLLLTAAIGCSGDADAQFRTLPSGHQVEVFRTFAQEGPRGRVLNYFYFSPHFGDEAAFTDEAAAVLLDAQREADEHKAQELILIANEKVNAILSLLTGRKSRSWLYRRSQKEWQKVRED